LGSQTWTIKKGSGSSTIATDANLPMGTSFEVQARCGNNFGLSDWSNIATFKTAGMGVGGGPLVVNFNFQALSGGLGVNTFNFPFTTVSSPTAIATVKDLAMAIINQNDPGNAISAITTIGWWDATKMQPAGYTVTKSGTDYIFAGTVGLGDAATVNLVKDQSYQVSVTRACTLTMTGTR